MCIALFVMLPVEAAAIWSLLGGMLLLPSGMQVQVPLLPPLDKTNITAVATLLLCLMKGAQAKAPRPSLLVYLLGLGFVISPVFTSLDNSYELQTAAGSIPGFYPLDGFKIAFRNAVILAPFYIGARFLCTDQARASLMKSLPTATLIYSLPMLFEVRISPQLHRWVYGYFPHSFVQQMRAGGFRPVVFMEHGLQVALFTSIAVIAAVVAARAKWRILHAPAGAVAAYLGVVLLLCKSLGPTLYAVVVAPIVLFTRPRLWTKIACVVLLVVCAYPVLRTHELIPVHHISDAANSISSDRSESFDTRVKNEDQLLIRANEKPFFGWGTWGRNRIYDQYSGKDISVTDGEWIIQYGTFGWFGYLSLFGLLALAAFRAARAVGDQVTPSALTLGGLALLLAVYAIDLVPNANPMSLTLLLAGSMVTAKVRSSKSVKQRVSGVRRSPVPASQ